MVTTVAAPVSTITSPASGATLSIGKLYPISWNSSTNYPYNIVLEQLGGAGAGFIATNLSGGAGYSWRAGNVFSSAAQADQTVATGTYRVRITAATGGVSDGDPVSGWFTLIGPPLALNSVSPTSLPVDGRSTAVIYGTGLNSSSVVYFDQQYGARANVQYISPDGTIMVITVPSSVSIGAHSLFIMNQYGTISNSLPFWTTVASQ